MAGKSGLTRSIAAAVGLALASAASAQTQVLAVQGNVHMLAMGGGANVVVQIGSDGIVVVDTSTSARAPEVLATIRRLSNKTIRYVINTHEHPDHVGGNAVISQAGTSFGEDEPLPFASIYAHEHVLNALGAPTGKKPALASEFWPTDTYFTSSMEIHFNGEPIELLHQPAAHSDGDVMVWFRKSDVIAAGDIFTPDRFPMIAVERGGTVQGLLDGLNHIIDIAVPRFNQQGGTLVVGGHGRIGNESDVVEYRDMTTIVRDRIKLLVEKNMTLDQVRAANVVLDYQGIYGATSGPWTTDMFIAAIFRDLTKPTATRRGQ